MTTKQKRGKTSPSPYKELIQLKNHKQNLHGQKKEKCQGKQRKE